MDIFQYNSQRKNPSRCTAKWDLVQPDDMLDLSDTSGLEVREYSTLGEYLKEVARLRAA